MALYEYKAVSPTGETVQGTMEGSSVEGVIARLQEAGNIPLQARQAGQGFLNLSAFRAGRRGMSTREVGEFTQQLSTLLGAGLPLDRSLGVLVDLAGSQRVQKSVGDVRERVRGGGNLSEALEAQHGAFGRLYINMVRAGEIGGSLDQTLARLSDYLDRSRDLKDAVISALIYPILLIFLAVGSLILLLVFVIPQFMPIFEELGEDLPLITKIVLAFGGVLQNYWWALAGLIFLAIVLFRRMLDDPDKKLRWDTRVLKLRWVGDLISKLEVARLSRTLGTLLVNGVPLLAALGIGGKVVGNSLMRQDLENAAREVKTGGGLTRSLANSGNFPRLALQMVSVGEETGQLDDMLLKVADSYDREVRNTIDRLLSVFTPVVTLLMAIMIGAIVLSVLLAIISVNDMVG